jgi:hypothetical protein
LKDSKKRKDFLNIIKLISTREGEGTWNYKQKINLVKKKKKI